MLYASSHLLARDLRAILQSSRQAQKSEITISPAYGPAHPHAAISAGPHYTYEYDNNGNMRYVKYDNQTQKTIAWTLDNKITSVNNGGTTTSFTYDYAGKRVKKVVGTSTTTYYFDRLYECTGSTCTSATSYIFVNGMRIAKKEGSTVRYFYKDHIQSASVEADLNGGGAQYCYYKPYGELISCGITDKYKFTDQEYDSELSLYNYGAREYDPMLARFMSADTIVPDPADPQTLNRYSYCRNNPVMYVDPSGHLFGIDDLTIGALAYAMLKGAAIGAGIGAGVSAATGGDIGQGALTGAISGAIFGGAGEVIQGLQAASPVTSITKAGIHAAAGTVSGGINAGITGGNIGMGMLTGGISGGLGEYLGGYIPTVENRYASFGIALGGRSLIGGISGGITSALYGGDFGEGFVTGAQTTALGYLANHFIHNTVVKGLASWYADRQGKPTGFAGESYDANALAGAAHHIRNGTWVTVEYDYVNGGERATNSLRVRINDHGPWAKVDGKWVDHPTRIIDLTPRAFYDLVGSLGPGVVNVRMIVP